MAGYHPSLQRQWAFQPPVVENINGGLARVAELLKRNEAELAPAAVPTAAADTGKEYGTFDMNEYL